MPKQAIFVLVDTQGTHCVGCYAQDPRLGTPNLDTLAKQGVRFNRAYSCSPVCGPARSAIFTGLYPHSNGVLGNDIPLQASIPTLGARLSKAGIHACYIGKWHLDGTDYFGDGRCPEGWDPDYWYDGRNYLESLPDRQARDLSRKVLGRREVSQHGITAKFTYAHRIADKAAEFIARHQDEDFFLVVSIDEPHHPFICPEPFVGRFDDFLIPVPNADDTLAGKPPAQREWADYANRLHQGSGLVRNDGELFAKAPHYLACNSFSDHEVGRVIAAVDKHTPQALVVYTADHGIMFGNHGGLLDKGPAMYEEITRIPWIIRWPGYAPPGFVSKSLVSHIDLVPTFLEFFGVPASDLLQGRSLLGCFRQPAERPHDAVFIEFNRYEVDHDGFGAFFPIRCVFNGRYKLAVNLLETDEFYDLEADPEERNNLISDSQVADIRDRLHDRLLEWMNATRDPLRGPHWGRRSWRTVVGSTWDNSFTRPRPFDEAFYPKTLLYDTGHEIDRYVYKKDQPRSTND